MLPFGLVGGGAVVLWATYLIARRTRRARLDAGPPHPPPYPEETGPILLADEPGSQRPPMRLWPVAGSLAGLLLIAGGLLQAQNGQTVPDETPRPFAIDLPLETTSPEPTLEASASPEPTASRVPTATPRASARPASTARATSTPRRTASPTARPPTPPPRPGPNVSASTSCFNRTAGISYQVQAKADTTLTSVSVLLDGRVVQQPKASGRTTVASSYSQDVAAGQHVYTIVARASDGGSTSKPYAVC